MGCDRTQNARLCIVSAGEALCCDLAASGCRPKPNYLKAYITVTSITTALMHMKQFCAVVIKTIVSPLECS